MIGFLIALGIGVFAFIKLDEKQREIKKLVKECNETNQVILSELKKMKSP
ncbi:hypothetical protein [Halalkalibacter akibai]|nr:hypothetical protein [Halalkalibacter akibai]